MIRGIIFDCDGVLLDSEPIFDIATKEMLKDLGIDPDLAFFHDCCGTTGLYFCEKLLERSPQIGMDPEKLNKLYLSYCDKLLMADDLKPMKGLYDFVKKQFSLGRKMAVASSSPYYYVKHKLDLFSIAPFFELIVSADDVTRSKPDPQIYEIASKKIGLNKEELIVIEDAPNGIKSAKAAGLYTVGFKGSSIEQDTSIAEEEVYNFADIRILKG